LIWYGIVLYLRLFSNMGDKTHPFTISLFNTFMQKVRVETSYRNKSNCLYVPRNIRRERKFLLLLTGRLKWWGRGRRW